MYIAAKLTKLTSACHWCGGVRLIVLDACSVYSDLFVTRGNSSFKSGQRCSVVFTLRPRRSSIVWRFARVSRWLRINKRLFLRVILEGCVCWFVGWNDSGPKWGAFDYMCWRCMKMVELAATFCHCRCSGKTVRLKQFNTGKLIMLTFWVDTDTADGGFC